MTTIGTSHFATLGYAIHYYSAYGFKRADVERKIKEGEIHIGEPPVKKGETLHLNREGRYEITIND